MKVAFLGLEFADHAEEIVAEVPRVELLRHDEVVDAGSEGKTKALVSKESHARSSRDAA